MDSAILGEENVLLVAELSANHRHDKDIAIATVRAAKESGADAIKLQTYTADTLTIDSNNEHFTIDEGLWEGKTLYELYKEAFTPWEWHQELFDVAADEGLLCFSTPFDNSSADFLMQFDIPFFKIASFEIQDIPLIKYVASKGKPMVISTGIATNEDIALAVETCRLVGNDQITLLKCTSAYPAPLEEANVRTMADMREKFGVSVGLSDHTIGNAAAVTATALGAVLIEKHFILDRKLGGPDAAFSVDPKEFKFMVEDVRNVQMALGQVTYSLSGNQEKNRQFARSIFVVKDIKAGEVFTDKHIRSIRPGFGLHPKHFEDIIGKRAKKDLERGEPMRSEYVH